MFYFLLFFYSFSCFSWHVSKNQSSWSGFTAFSWAQREKSHAGMGPTWALWRWMAYFRKGKNSGPSVWNCAMNSNSCTCYLSQILRSPSIHHISHITKSHTVLRSYSKLSPCATQAISLLNLPMFVYQSTRIQQPVRKPSHLGGFWLNGNHPANVFTGWISEKKTPGKRTLKGYERGFRLHGISQESWQCNMEW